MFVLMVPTVASKRHAYADGRYSPPAPEPRGHELRLAESFTG